MKISRLITRPRVKKPLRGFGGLIGGSSNPVFTPEALTLFAAMTTPPTTARKIVINNLIVSLQASGVWNLLDVLYLTAATDSQAGRLDWKSSGTFDLLAVNSPTFVADRGYIGDGASSRLRTQYTPSVNGVNFTQNSASAWDYSLTELQSAAADIGSATGPRVYVDPRTAANQLACDINGNANFASANASSIGFFGVQRRGATDRRVFVNGAQTAADAAASTGTTSQEQWVCGANASNFSQRRVAAAAWGASLSGLESSFYSSILTYMQAVGAA